jgi:carbonic anhydrase
MFHAPAQHEFDGDSFDLEMDVHCPASTGTVNHSQFLFVYDKGDSDTIVEDMISNSRFSIPSGVWNNFYSYKGAHMYPPCLENVHYFLFTDPGEVSTSQLDFFHAMWQDNTGFASGKGNNRVIQTLKSGSVYITGDEYDDFALAGVAAVMTLLFL